MQIIGIQLDKPFLRTALLEKSRDQIKITLIKSAPLSDPADVKQLYFPNFKGTIAAGLLTKDVLIRSIELKINDNRHLKQALEFHCEATTHLNPSEIISIPRILKKENREVEALLFTTPKKSLHSHLSELEKLGIDPDRVSVYSIALVHYIRWKIPSLQNGFLVHLGSDEWTCVLMEKGELKKAYGLSCGMEALFTALWEDRKKILLPKEIEGAAKQIDLLQLKSHLNPHLSLKINEMKQELTKIIFSFHRASGPLPFILTGHHDSFGNLSEFLKQDFKEIISPDNFSFPFEEQKYAIPIGLALEESNPSVQFLQQEFFPKKNWKKTGFYSLLLIASSFILTSLILLIGNQSLEARKSKMIESLETTLNHWDPELQKLIFTQNKNEETILSEWLATVAKYNKEYPYILQAPKLSELLLWISNHPFLLQIQKEGDPIEIHEITYQLVQYPNIDSPKDDYQAKVELEFKTQSPLNARKFHELLLNEDSMIDGNAGINWEMLNEGYRTSFFLKNRTPYVP